MSTEKIDIHYHQQLSALIDGELPPDQARFLLRRLQHDEELAGSIDRWQMLGDVLRGNAVAPAPEGFSARVAATIAAEAPAAVAARKTASGRRTMWGGGAIAASVAAVAFFVVVPQVPDESDTRSSPVVAAQQAAPELLAPRIADAPDVATPTATQSPADTVRPGATGNRQASRTTALVAQAPQRVASVGSLPVIHSIAAAPSEYERGNPFADVRMDPPAARPWPRAVLPQYSSGAFNAGYPAERAALEFYPFEPSLPPVPPATQPAPRSGEDQ